MQPQTMKFFTHPGQVVRTKHLSIVWHSRVQNKIQHGGWNGVLVLHHRQLPRTVTVSLTSSTLITWNNILMLDWTHLYLYKSPPRSYFDRIRPSDYVRFGRIWSDSVRFGRIWPDFDFWLIRSIWSDSVGFGRIWTDSVGFGRIWSDLVGFGIFHEYIIFSSSIELERLNRVDLQWSIRLKSDRNIDLSLDSDP